MVYVFFELDGVEDLCLWRCQTEVTVSQSQPAESVGRMFWSITATNVSELVPEGKGARAWMGIDPFHLNFHSSNSTSSSSSNSQDSL